MHEINEEGKSILLTNEGMEFAEKLLLENNLIKQGTLQDLDNMSLNHNIIQALRAHKLFIRDKKWKMGISDMGLILQNYQNLNRSIKTILEIVFLRMNL